MSASQLAAGVLAGVGGEVEEVEVVFGGDSGVVCDEATAAFLADRK